MSRAVTIITEQVRERVRRDGIDLGSDRALADRYVRDEVQRYSERALGGSLPMLPDEHRAAREIVASIIGFGALQPFFDDPEIEEIWINAPDRVFIARNGVPELTSVALAETEIRDLVERMLQSSGSRVDLSSPFVDASLSDGSRLHVVIPDTGNAQCSGAHYCSPQLTGARNSASCQIELNHALRQEPPVGTTNVFAGSTSQCWGACRTDAQLLSPWMIQDCSADFAFEPAGVGSLGAREGAGRIEESLSISVAVGGECVRN